MGEVILSVLKVTVKKPALYTCVASNKHSAGANTVKASARVTVAGTVAFDFYLFLGTATINTILLFYFSSRVVVFERLLLCVVSAAG